MLACLARWMVIIEVIAEKKEGCLEIKAHSSPIQQQRHPTTLIPPNLLPPPPSDPKKGRYWLPRTNHLLFPTDALGAF